MNEKEFIEGFILYPTYRVEGNNSFIYLYGRLKDGRSFCTKNKFNPFFYIKTKDRSETKKVDLRSIEPKFEETNLKNFEGELVTKIITKTPREIPELRKSFEEKGIECYEADIRFSYRFLIENNLKGALRIKGKLSKKSNEKVDCFFEEPVFEPSEWRPKPEDFRILSLDIETSQDAKKLYCISLYSNDKKLNKVLLVSEKRIKHADSFKDEKSLLEAFKEELLNYDPDIITGWNLIDFDLKIIEQKMKDSGIEFDLGRTNEKCNLKIFESFMTDSKADFPGRMVLDGIHILKTSFIKLDDYKLGTAAKEFTKEKKLIEDENKGEDIDNAFKKDQQKLVDYNLLDSKLALDIIVNSGGMQLTILRSLLTGMTLDKVRASIASLDSLYLRELKKRGIVAPSAKFVERTERTTGGYVMNSKPGIYDYVIVCDFKSLYPSIMRTFNIDPLMHKKKCTPEQNKDKHLIIAPNGACFSKEQGILPDILQRLWKERDAARKNKDEVSRWAIKILMNSMYGVIASPNCRFYSFEVANAITSFGHMMIKETAKLLKQKGYEIIYGDTDSIFIDLKEDSVEKARKIGKAIETEINNHYAAWIKETYGVESKLELEFEKTYKKFLMPKVRGSEEGAKKRYAGLLVKDDDTEVMDFTGLEFVRRDWTEVSKKFQLELLDLIFHDKEILAYVKTFVQNLKSGKYDNLLIYRKALRKDVDDYTKTTPPHVKAARQLDKITSNIIDYVITVEGPEPIQKLTHSIDYDHYIDKQIKPIADSVLYFFGQKFEDVIKGSEQKNLGDW